MAAVAAGPASHKGASSGYREGNISDWGLLFFTLFPVKAAIPGRQLEAWAVVFQRVSGSSVKRLAMTFSLSLTPSWAD